MKKHNLLSMGLGAAILMSAAAPASAGEFYLGGEMGWTDVNFETTTTSFEESGLGASGFSGSALAGYQVAIPSGILGFEVNVGDSSAEYEATSDTYQETITRDVSYGISAMLGTNLSDNTHLYGRLGYQATSMELTARQAGTGVVEEFSKDKTYTGARVGAGIQTAVTDDLSVRLEWTRTIYSEETLAYNGSEVDVQPGESRVAIGILGRF